MFKKCSWWKRGNNIGLRLKTWQMYFCTYVLISPTTLSVASCTPYSIISCEHVIDKIKKWDNMYKIICIIYNKIITHRVKKILLIYYKLSLILSYIQKSFVCILQWTGPLLLLYNFDKCYQYAFIFLSFSWFCVSNSVVV